MTLVNAIAFDPYTHGYYKVGPAGLSCAYYLAVEGYQAFYLAVGAQGGRSLYMCIGCGLCMTRCKFDAIHLVHRTNTTPDFYEKLPIKFAANAVKRSGRIAATAVKETVRRG